VILHVGVDDRGDRIQPRSHLEDAIGGRFVLRIFFFGHPATVGLPSLDCVQFRDLGRAFFGLATASATPPSSTLGTLFVPLFGRGEGSLLSMILEAGFLGRRFLGIPEVARLFPFERSLLEALAVAK
jgi:hypothetical protein